MCASAILSYEPKIIMKSNPPKKYHVIIAGAGAMGLWLAYCLSKIGYRVLVLESREVVASGPSIRNEGWLHAGSYHAVAILDAYLALIVATRTRRGHELTLKFCPEAVERWSGSTFALIRPETQGLVTNRWRAAGVNHEPVPIRLARALLPGVKLSEYG